MTTYINASTDDLIFELNQRGFVVESDPSSAQFNLLREEEKEINIKIANLELRATEIRKEYQSICQHSFGESRYSDGWDGYSRVTITETESKICKKCGYIHTREFEVSH
ncbi:hypothetical protein P13BB106kb_p046 [Pectobacterium phage DU_PP_V]|uniref:Uncharacterized protein n=1 Tax=Pectobacterium phage DU_PP_V TaxID=2041492 RepID=A0A2D2W767_9CAUD|nr:hypothetical protein HOS40_gp123 [Pectobacterium phage DU_PP_V]ATS94030.1 hypothetical protein P13BB106kb_p046 [Pectobacterium phage DU_PP_V]